MQPDTPIEKIPTAKNTKISAAAKIKAEKVLLDTMGISENIRITKENFKKRLSRSIRQLQRYKELEEELKNVDKHKLPYELFKIIRREKDKRTKTQKDAPNDGVLIRSIQNGPLECAGRVMIASELLQKHKVNHAVVSAPGHSFIIINLGNNTLGYLDANNNLYFTFPRKALAGFKGTQKNSRSRLKEYVPRSDDKIDGISSAFTDFVTMPPSEGVARQYLGNVAAALAGNKEFYSSKIKPDKEQAQAIHDLEIEILGKKNQTLDNFLEKTESLVKSIEKKSKFYKKAILEIYKSSPTKNAFSVAFASVIEGHLGDEYPYLKRAPKKIRVEHGRKTWDALKNQTL